MRAQLLIIAAIVLIGCTGKRRADEPLPPLDPTRLSHARHAQIACDNCHRTSDARPGVDEHRPCDDGACHRKEFLAPPGDFCKVCHESVTSPPLAAPLRKYPSDDLWQSLPPVFSHRLHMDAGRMESQVGFHVACADCHMRDGKRVTPDHETCTRCHAAEVGLAKAPTMTACTTCHTTGARPRKRARLIRGDLVFSHERHMTDRKNNAIRCDACHVQSSGSTRYEDHAPPRVESCVGCHDDSDRTPVGNRMRVCETCHTTRSGCARPRPRGRGRARAT